MESAECIAVGEEEDRGNAVGEEGARGREVAGDGEAAVGSGEVGWWGGC